MSSKRSRRIHVSLALLALLVLVPCLASARQTTAPRSSAAVRATSAGSSSFLALLWHSLRSLRGAEGMDIDPNGAHRTNTGTSSGLTAGGSSTIKGL